MANYNIGPSSRARLMNAQDPDRRKRYEASQTGNWDNREQPASSTSDAATSNEAAVNIMKRNVRNGVFRFNTRLKEPE